jgi:hypothetical protein
MVVVADYVPALVYNFQHVPKYYEWWEFPVTGYYSVPQSVRLDYRGLSYFGTWFDSESGRTIVLGIFLDNQGTMSFAEDMPLCLRK